MDLRKELSLEQQFELQVFEQQVQQLSQADAHTLLVKMRESMLYQSATFREILKDSWRVDQGFDTGFNDLLT
ncbi:MAG: NblA-related protein [Leptolyngbya sp. SIOISBB]|nr:NblA-related protein [Leptolyngbya sp. SIOISBB]